MFNAFPSMSDFCPGYQDGYKCYNDLYPLKLEFVGTIIFMIFQRGVWYITFAIICFYKATQQKI